MMHEIQRRSYQSSATKHAESKRQWRTLIAALLVLDALCVLGSLALAYVVRIDGLIPYYAEPNDVVYRNLVLIAIPAWLICFAVLGLYRRDNLLGGVVEYKQVIKGCTAGVLLLVMGVVFARVSEFEPSRGWLILSWLISIALVGATRFFVRRIVYRLREYDLLTSRVLIVGANDQGVAIAEQWMSTAASGMKVIGFLDDFKTLGTTVTGNVKVIGRPSALEELSRQVQADEIVVVSSAVAWESFGELVTRNDMGKDYTLRLSPGFYELLTTGVAVTTKTFVPLLTIHENRIVGIDAVLKWLIDFGFGGLLTVLSLPVSLVVGISLKLRRPHQPILKRTFMVGRGGTSFGMYQFNTALDPHSFNRVRKSRSFEYWLRITGLDKLPQLWNVMRGQMSLVGPRPRTARNQVTDMHTMHNLQAVKPGIVGPWVRRDHSTSPDMTHDELNYVRNWQVWTDLPILFQAGVMLGERIVSVGKRRSASDDRDQSPNLDTNLSEDMLF